MQAASMYYYKKSQEKILTNKLYIHVEMTNYSNELELELSEGFDENCI